MWGLFDVKARLMAAGLWRNHRGLYKALIKRLLLLYPNWRHLDAVGLPVCTHDERHGARPGGGKREPSVILELHGESLWIIPVGLAIWFMLWVLWSWHKEERR